MARSSHLSRRDGGRYYLQIRLKRFSPGSPSRLVRFSLGTSDYVTARHLLADRMAWLLPLQTAQSNQQRYRHIRSQLSAFNGQAPVTDRSKLAARLAEQLNLVDDAAVAFVKLQVKPDAWRRSSRAYGPCRRALVVFPFDPALNHVLKNLGPDQVKFDGASKAWSVAVYTDAAVDCLIRRLLKSFDALLVDDLGRTAVVYH